MKGQLVLGMDVSSFQPRDLTDLIQAHSVSHVVVKLYQTIENIPQSYSINQIHSAQANNCTVGGYVWLYHGVNPRQQVQDAVELAEKSGIDLPLLWIDCETYEGEAPTLEEVLEAVQMCHDLSISVGIYTGNWFVRDYWGGDIGALVDYPVWLADYNNQADLLTPSPYWPREKVLGHQYSSNPVDIDVFDGSVTSPEESPQTEAEVIPAPDLPSYEDLLTIVGYITGPVADAIEAELKHKPRVRPEVIAGLLAKIRESKIS